ncbi:MAG: M3 family oligoendopeptidase [Chthonomonadales bacterium]|nr:M3 family oligoendopeptidase [Chthonomonadales bacterium]
MTEGTMTLPRWDLESVFTSIESEEFGTEFEAICAGIDELVALFDARGVRRRDQEDVDAAFACAFDEVTGAFNALQERLCTLDTYLGCLVTTNAADDAAQARSSELEARCVALDQLGTRYVAWVGTSDVDALLGISEVARAHSYPLHRAREVARYQMSEPEENLVAELRPSSMSGWARLHSDLTALLSVSVPSPDGSVRELPMSAARSLGSDRERAARRLAYEAEIEAWRRNALPLAAAINGIKGMQRTLRARRGYADDVEPTLLRNGTDAETLKAMQRACAESFADFRRYMAAKARMLGVERLAWYDLGAPVGAEGKRWTWPEAEEFVRRNFRAYSTRMADFADRAFGERWIDAEPRIGKVGGAYCAGIRPGESRILMNFDGSFTSVSTLAHELGHAYHNLNLAGRAPMQRSTPSTLAETASIFCETLAFEAAAREADRRERAALLDTVLARDLQVVVDIHSRFLFEKGVFERRAARDLAVSELTELMLTSQRATYGDSIEPLHPFMWAVKGHYYGPTFYNYPYTFGLLFGIGLYARYRDDPIAFRARYDALLSSTGLADAHTLAAGMGIELRDIAFWRASLDVIRGEIRQFEELARGATP